MNVVAAKMPPKAAPPVDDDAQWLRDWGPGSRPDKVSAGFRWIRWSWEVPLFQAEVTDKAGHAHQVFASNQRLVLCALARHANLGGAAWPNSQTLCAETCLGRQTLFRTLAALLNSGLVEKIKRRGSNVYRLRDDREFNR